MDDQNQTNKPIDQSATSGTFPPTPPVVPAAPIEDITPSEPMPAPQYAPFAPPAPATPAAPEPTTTFTTTVTTPQPTTEPETPFMSPQPEATTTFTTTVTTPTPEPQFVPSQPAPMAPIVEEPMATPALEPTMPETKPKNKILPIIGGALALLLVVGVAGAAYYVSNQLSTRQAVAPNAPESEPMASSGVIEVANTSCSGDFTDGEYCCTCKGDGSSKATCKRPGVIGAIGYDTTATYCLTHIHGKGGGDDDDTCAKEWTAKNKDGITCDSDDDCYSGLSDKCNDGVLCDESAKKCYSPYYKAKCDANWSWADCGGLSCGSGQRREKKACTYSGTTRTTIMRGNGTNGGKGCTYTQACVDEVCPVADRQKPKEKTITFKNAGTIKVFTRSMKGKITLTKGTETVVIDSTSTGSAVMQAKTFAVTAGSTYAINVELDAEKGKKAYGWINPKGTGKNLCGANGEGKCGGDADASAVIAKAKENANLAGIYTSGETDDSSVQCWGDAPLKIAKTDISDSTQNYDFNDFTVVFGYAKETIVAGVCSDINIYLKKADGTYNTTPMTQVQLGSLRVGDVIKFAVTGSMDDLKARFLVRINNSAGDYYVGVPSTENKKLSIYSNYKVEKAGSYKFTAEVSTEP